MIRQRIYQIGAGYEDCNDADFLRKDPALRLALGKDHQAGAGQSMLCRLENDTLGNEAGLFRAEGIQEVCRGTEKRSGIKGAEWP